MPIWVEIFSISSKICEDNKIIIEKINGEIFKISNIIEDLNLTMSLETLKKDRFKKQDPLPIIRKLIVDKSNENPNRKILFENNSTKIDLDMDINLFYRMIENILKNSLNYTQGLIKVSTKICGKNFLIIFEDEGSGVSDYIINRINNSDINDIRTHELGLFISKQICEIHCGNFKISNTPKGSKVTFLFNL